MNPKQHEEQFENFGIHENSQTLQVSYFLHVKLIICKSACKHWVLKNVLIIDKPFSTISISLHVQPHIRY